MPNRLAASPHPDCSDDGGAIERTTDELAMLPYAALGPAGCAELRSPAMPFSLAMARELLPWVVGRLVAQSP